MDTLRILSFYSQQEAHIVLGSLKNEGIDCFLRNENTAILVPHHTIGMGGGIDLMVYKDDYNKALEILTLLGYFKEEEEK